MIFCHLTVVLSDRMVTARGYTLLYIYIGEAAEERRAVALGLLTAQLGEKD